MSEPHIRFAIGLADQASAIERGRIALSGAMAEVAAQDDLWRKYLVV